MVYLALNRDNLSRLSYHFFWGLQVDELGATNLYQEASWYHYNPRDRQQMFANVQNMAQRKGFWGALVRAFCWVLNWNNYRFDYYNTQAYVSWQIYEHGIGMLSTAQKDTAENEGGFFVAGSLDNVALIDNFLNKGSRGVQISVQQITTPLLWIEEHALSVLTDDRTLVTHDFATVKTHFFVNEEMLDLLEVLEIYAEPDNAVAYDDLKAAYKACCLKTHPDKPHGNAADFIQVKNAYDTLLALIKNINDPFGIQDEIDAYLQKKDEELQKLRLLVKTAHERKAKFDANFDKYMETSTRYLAISNQLNQRIDQYCKRADRQKQQIEENGRRIDKLFEQVAELQEYFADAEEQEQYESSSTADGEDYWSEEQESDHSSNQSTESQALNIHRIFTPVIPNPTSFATLTTAYENKF